MCTIIKCYCTHIVMASLIRLCLKQSTHLYVYFTCGFIIIIYNVMDLSNIIDIGVEIVGAAQSKYLK